MNLYSSNNFISRMLSQMTINSNENNISNDRIKPALTPDMLNFGVKPSAEIYSKNKDYQYNSTNAARNVKNKVNYYNNDNINDNIDNKNSSLQETPSEKIKLRHNLNVKENNENNENKSDTYAKDLDNNKTINKNDNDYDNSNSNRNSYYYRKENSNNIILDNNINHMEEFQKPQNEEKKIKIASAKDPFSDISIRLKENQSREKKYAENYSKSNEFNYSINNNDSNDYNTNNKNVNKNLDTFNSDKTKYKPIQRSESFDTSNSQSSTSSPISAKLSSLSSSNIKPISPAETTSLNNYPFSRPILSSSSSSTSLVSNSHHDFLNRSNLQSPYHITNSASSASLSQNSSLSSAASPNKKSFSKFNVVINIDRIEIRSVDRKKITNTKETSSKRYSQSLEEYYKRRFS